MGFIMAWNLAQHNSFFQFPWKMRLNKVFHHLIWKDICCWCSNNTDAIQQILNNGVKEATMVVYIAQYVKHISSTLSTEEKIYNNAGEKT